jgi:hypothetical protein
MPGNHLKWFERWRAKLPERLPPALLISLSILYRERRFD